MPEDRPVPSVGRAFKCPKRDSAARRPATVQNAPIRANGPSGGEREAKRKVSCILPDHPSENQHPSEPCAQSLQNARATDSEGEVCPNLTVEPTAMTRCERLSDLEPPHLASAARSVEQYHA
jgi:hypothetical protein